MTHDQTYEFACKKLRETESAILVRDHERGDLWFPLSCVHEMHFHAKTGDGTIIVDEWIARKKGLL